MPRLGGHSGMAFSGATVVTAPFPEAPVAVKAGVFAFACITAEARMIGDMNAARVRLLLASPEHTLATRRGWVSTRVWKRPVDVFVVRSLGAVVAPGRRALSCDQGLHRGIRPRRRGTTRRRCSSRREATSEPHDLATRRDSIECEPDECCSAREDDTAFEDKMRHGAMSTARTVGQVTNQPAKPRSRPHAR